MITWYQVYTTNNTVYGFKTDGVVVLDHPNRFWVGETLQSLRNSFTKDKVNQVSKIADICE